MDEKWTLIPENLIYNDKVKLQLDGRL